MTVWKRDPPLISHVFVHPLITPRKMQCLLRLLGVMGTRPVRLAGDKVRVVKR